MTDSMLQQIDAYLDGTLEAAAMRQLDAWIETDPDAADLFAERSYLDWYLREGSQAKVHPEQLPPTLKLSPAWRSRSAWYAAAAMLLLAAVAWFLLLPSDQPPSSNLSTMTTSSSIAMLTDHSDDAIFDNESHSPRLGQELAPGPIRLIAGNAQILFHSGTVVDLTGPCEFEMLGPNQGRLVLGRLEALVNRQARGFTISMPGSGRLIDLGTRFTARIEPQGITQVAVMQGRVRWELPDHEPVVLTAGHSDSWFKGMLASQTTEATVSEAPIAVFDFNGQSTTGEPGGSWRAVDNIQPWHDGAIVLDGGTEDKPARRTVFVDLNTNARWALARSETFRAADQNGSVGGETWLCWTMHGSNPQPMSWAGLSLFDGSDDRKSAERLFIGKALGHMAYSYAIPYGGGNADLDVNPTTTTIDRRGMDDQRHRLVMRIQWRQGPDRVSIWVDPDVTRQTPAQPHALIHAINVRFDRLRFECGNGSGVWKFDDLRVGPTWHSVLPKPADDLDASATQ